MPVYIQASPHLDASLASTKLRAKQHVEMQPLSKHVVGRMTRDLLCIMDIRYIVYKELMTTMRPLIETVLQLLRLLIHRTDLINLIV